MEVLGVAASIVGLVAAAGKVIGAVAPVLSSLQVTARIAAPAHAEVVNCRIILSAPQGLFDMLSSVPPDRVQTCTSHPSRRLSILTDGVLFSGLEALVRSVVRLMPPR